MGNNNKNWNPSSSIFLTAFNTKFQLSALIPPLKRPLSICPISFNLILQQDNYDLHPTHKHLSPLM